MGAVLVLAAAAVVDAVKPGKGSAPEPALRATVSIPELQRAGGSRAIERIGAAWSRRFASNGLVDCYRTSRELCARLHCSQGGVNCTLPTRAYRRSFRAVAVDGVVIVHDFGRRDDGGAQLTISEKGGEPKTAPRVNPKTRVPAEDLEAGNVEQAVAEYRKLQAANPKDPNLSEERFNQLGYEYLRKKDYTTAIAIFRLNTEFYPDSANPWDSLGEALEGSGDKAGAAKALEGAMYVRPMDLQGHAKLGTYLLDLKQYAGAAREYETLLALKTPDRATTYYLLAQSYLGQGKKAEARKAVLSSLDIAPSYEPAQKLLVEILK